MKVLLLSSALSGKKRQKVKGYPYPVALSGFPSPDSDDEPTKREIVHGFILLHCLCRVLCAQKGELSTCAFLASLIGYLFVFGRVGSSMLSLSQGIKYICRVTHLLL